MLRQWTTRKLLLLALITVAAAGLSCAGGPEAGSVAGVSAMPPAASEEGAATVSASGLQNKTLVCHRGKDKWVSAGALADHLAHGDMQRSCSEPDVAVCPCQFESSISDNILRHCGGSTTGFCSIASVDSSLYLYCNASNSFLIGTYLVQGAEGSFCSVNEPVAGNQSRADDLTEAEYQACRAELVPHCL